MVQLKNLQEKHHRIINGVVSSYYHAKIGSLLVYHPSSDTKIEYEVQSLKFVHKQEPSNAQTLYIYIYTISHKETSH